MSQEHAIGLSKSRLLSGHRCIRKLWIEVHEPPDDDGDLPRAVRCGRTVGEVARLYYPGGQLIEGDPGERLATTSAELQRGSRVLFEASFTHGGLFVSTDVLQRRRYGFVLTEVKAGTYVKDEYVLDVAVQMYVLRAAGVDVRRAEVMTLNRNCRHPDLTRLFVRHDVTAKARKLARTIPDIAREVRRGLASRSLPVVTPERARCGLPYPCEFMDRCWDEQPEDHVSRLYRIGKRRLDGLLRRGIESINDVPETEQLGAVADRQRRAVQSGRIIVEGGLHAALSRFTEPFSHLDFETVSLPVPRWSGCRPYERLPVQFSLHRETRSGLWHVEWIADGTGDPRPALAAALVHACRGRGTVFAYSASFERGCIDGLIAAVPALADELRAIRDRIEDLHPIVRDHVYHPAFGGRFSLKSVHPALTGRDMYCQMAISDGESAMDAHETLMTGTISSSKRTRLRRALLRYCAADTRALVEIRRRLLRLAGSQDR
jgi:predicted RecB family nuclease